MGAVETITANRGDGSDDVRINGKTIDLTSATDLQESCQPSTPLLCRASRLSADDDGNLILTSVSGENIKVETLQETSGEFFDTLQNISGEKNALSATLKIGGTVEATDVFEVTINGTKVAVTSGSTDTSVVASTIASALNLVANGVSIVTATGNSDGTVTIAGDTAGDFVNIQVATGEVFAGVTEYIGTDSNYGSPSDGQTFQLVSNGIEMFGSLTLNSETGAEIVIEDKSGTAATKMGLAQQGGSSDMIGGSMSVTYQAGAERALTQIDWRSTRLT